MPKRSCHDARSWQEALSPRADLPYRRAALRRSFPVRPIRLHRGFRSGRWQRRRGAAARALHVRRLGQPIVVENRTGATGNLATQYVAQSETGRLHAAGVERIADRRRARAYPDMEVDPVKDLALMSAWCRRVPSSSSSSPSLPVTNVEQFAAFCKEQARSR